MCKKPSAVRRIYFADHLVIVVKPKKRPRLELEEGEVNSEVEDEAEPADGEDLREIADETDDGSKPQVSYFHLFHPISMQRFPGNPSCHSGRTSDCLFRRSA